MQSLLRQIFSNYSYSGTAGIFELVSIVVMGVFLPRYLGQESYGTYLLASALSGVIFGLVDLGVNSTLSRELAKGSLSSFVGPTVLTNNALSFRISSGAVTLLLVQICIILFFDSSSKLGALLPITSATAFVLSITSLMIAAMNGVMAYRLQFITTVSNRILAVLFVAAALAKASLTGVAVGLLMAHCLTLVLAGIMFHRLFHEIRFCHDLRIWWRLLLESYPVALSSMASSFTLRSDTILLGYFKGTTEAGMYGAAYSIFLGIGSLSSYFLTAAFPVLSRANVRNATQGRKLFLVLLAMYCAVSILLILVLNLYTEPIVLALFGSQYQKSTVALRLLSFGAAAMVVNRLTTNTLVSISQQRYALYAIGAGTVANVVLNILFLPQFGFVAASITTFIGEFVVVLLSLWYLSSHYRTLSSPVEFLPNI